MKRLLCAALLGALAGCLPTDPTTTDQYPAPQMRKVGAPMGDGGCTVASVGEGLPVIVTDSGAWCPRTQTTAQVLEWNWPRDRNGTCGLDLTHARRVYGCIDMDPL